MAWADAGHRSRPRSTLSGTSSRLGFSSQAAFAIERSCFERGRGEGTMALDRFLYARLRFWFLVVLFAGVGVLGVWAYFHWNGQSEAVATVAVLEPVASLG